MALLTSNDYCTENNEDGATSANPAQSETKVGTRLSEVHGSGRLPLGGRGVRPRSRAHYKGEKGVSGVFERWSGPLQKSELVAAWQKLRTNRVRQMGEEGTRDAFL
jgi:hypothetical protein